MSTRPEQRTSRASEDALPVDQLPTFGFGHRSLMWWGTIGLVVVESTVFALAIMTYLYLRSHANVWPMSRQPPDLLWGTINTFVLLLSTLPNHWTKKAAERFDLQTVRRGMVACLLFSVAFLLVRAMEFAALNCNWDSNAYGSAVWMLMGLHTVHLLTDTYDSAVLGVLMYTGPLQAKRFVDVSENAAYWYFVVLSWLPIYAIVYWGARV